MSSTPSHQLDPIPESKRSERVQDRAFTLFVDDKRVPGKYKVESDGVEVRVTWVTSVAALDDPNADFEAQLAWGGWKPGDTVHVANPFPRAKSRGRPVGPFKFCRSRSATLRAVRKRIFSATRRLTFSIGKTTV